MDKAYIVHKKCLVPFSGYSKYSANIHWALTITRTCSKYFSYINSFKLQIIFKVDTMMNTFYRQENNNTEKFINLPLVSGRGRIWTQGV